MADEQQKFGELTVNEAATYLGVGEGELVQDPDAIAARIVARILEAETLDDVFASQETTAAGDVLDKVLTVTDVSYNASDIGEGPGVYAIVTAKDPNTGDNLTISCGARNVMAQLFKCRDLGALPLNVRFKEAAKASSRGYRPMWLELVKPGEEDF